MKKLLKILLKLVGIGLILFFLSIMSVVYYFETSIDKVMTVENQAHLMHQIKSSPELPPNIYHTLEKYKLVNFERGVWDKIYLSLKNRRSTRCEAWNISHYFGLVDYPIRFYQLTLALEIEERCTQKQCFNYEMQHTAFGMNIRGIKQAARDYYHKELIDLSERETVELFVITRAPTYYNPVLNPENLKRKADLAMGIHP
jgi:hypothetical protein